MAEQRSTHTPQDGRLRLLVVDDSPSVRRELRALLELVDDVQVVGEASDGTRALELAPSLSPDVILLDLEMPALDGYAAAPRLKALLPGCRLVALTVHAGRADRERAARAGFDVFVVKGSPLAQLIEAITSPSSVMAKERS